ncbi:hypothetical protein FSP39_003868 [Pinctada imbricata]|uniref:ABC-type xenobiotic transporter n=1 Tax=Pinctada imbricata TaxID=66713 RepID=A0AA89BSD7_PINIB|nr:hypothetical protein FSP39_003868 [Pinctada imbricata]
MGKSNIWSVFCGHNENFTAWEKQDFGPCFEQLVIVIPAHVLLAVISTFHAAQSRKPNLGNYVYKLPHVVKLRFICVLFLMIIPPIGLLVSWKVVKLIPSTADILTISLQFLCWFIHSIYVFRLKFLFWVSYRGPASNLCAYGLTFVSACLQLHSAIVEWIHPSDFSNNAYEISTVIFVGFHLLYALSLIPYKQHALGVEFLSRSLNIDSPSEEEPIVRHAGRSYGAIPSKIHSEEVGEENSSFLSKLTFYWAQPLMVKGYKQLLKSAKDLFILPQRLSTIDIEKKFSMILQQRTNVLRASESEEQRQLSDHNTSINNHFAEQIVQVHQPNKKKSDQRTLLSALNKAFGLQYYSLGILKLLADLSGFAGPVLLNLLVSYIENKSEPESHGYFYAGGLLLSTLFGSLCSTQFDYQVQVVGFKIRCAIISTVYRKSLSVSSVSVTKFSSGQIVNFMSTDTDRVVNFCPSFHAFWSLPFQIAVSLYLLHQQVGLAFLAGLGFAVILVPINKWLANKIGQLSTEMMHQKDSRVKLMNEVLFGMRVIKFYAWEDLFKSRIEKLRAAELKSLKGRKYLDAMCVYFWATTPVLISILTFATYSLMGNQLTAAKVFTSLSLFLMLISPLNAFPWVLNGLMEAWVSLKRLQSFVALTDFDHNSYYSQEFDPYNSEELIKVRKATFSWKDHFSSSDTKDEKGLDSKFTDEECSQEEENTLILRNINFTIEQGQFIGVIGKVGSGKSSLLNALLAEMCRLQGQISVRNLLSGFSFVSQEPWIQHASIKDNILFGSEFSSRKYEAVLDAAALMEDLKVLPAGDRTEVGENGVTLSGGQKARLTLARAIYQEKEIYLLDDPLSAVDSHVAQHLYEKCIMGLLKNKTRILCTHHTKYLMEADFVILMEDGHLSQIGPPSQILDYIDLKKSQANENEAEISHDATEDIGNQDGGLVEDEEKETGVVRLSVYKAYWRAVGQCLSPMVLSALFLMQASRNINDWWLSYWVSHSHTAAHHDNHSIVKGPLSSSQDRSISDISTVIVTSTSRYSNLTQAEDNVTYYLMIYGILAGANSLFTLARAFLFAYGGICAAQVLHTKLLSTILKAPISFFDVTPIGRIVNRFSSDLYSIDDSLPFIMNIFLAQLYGILGTIVVTCYGLPWFAILLAPLALIYHKIQQYYRHTSREIKRITSITLSPIYAHFSETVSGLVTIRAFRESERFRQENLQHLDLNQRAQFAGCAVASWLSFRLQMMGVVMVTGISFIAVLEHHFHGVNPGLVGLALSYALSVTNLLSGVVNSFSETEKQMVSVERAQQYIDNIPSEQLEGSLMVSPLWPSNGVIVFSDVKLCYRAGLPNALDGVSFISQPGEKIGIVGRTGSGKSSLFSAIFRMVEIHNGTISVDGTNLQHIDLKDVRSHLAVIPQDPFLFSGSVRDNLDPAAIYTDLDLWTVLERCHLKEVVVRLGGLEADVAERGRHFSVGQRQLICLARALLRRTKVLCIDEATASVDMETDAIIQETIRTEFCDSTVLTIAHRINTVLDSDRVLVMREGKVAELDSPSALLQNSKSMFYKLVNSHQS